MPSTPGLSFGYAMPAAPLPLNSPTESSDFGAAIAALGFNLGDMEPLSTGTGALASAGRSGHHHQAAAPSTAVPTWTSGPPSHAQAAVPPPHLYHQQQQQQHYTYHPQGLGVHHDAEAFIYFPQQGCWNTAGGSTGPGWVRWLQHQDRARRLWLDCVRAHARGLEPRPAWLCCLALGPILPPPPASHHLLCPHAGCQGQSCRPETSRQAQAAACSRRTAAACPPRTSSPRMAPTRGCRLHGRMRCEAQPTVPLLMRALPLPDALRPMLAAQPY